ncbi:MipA/OmpV family protein [Trinickia fusca]|uniref:MipA/OmpV family protein n=1 Tax=Trinickia fusca TaxID=2419777 RepID=A0A494XAT4_9BURK|nr:MipA/OmpV family protein [Trinickia fusca]RKP45566.1 MipA/OmpV family protein [Trinickia fusca]
MSVNCLKPLPSSRIARYRTMLGAAFVAGTITYGSCALAQQPTANSIGIDLTALPRYQGSSAYRLVPLPTLSFKSPSASAPTYFVDGLVGGIAYPLGPHVAVGPLIGVGIGRREGDAAILSGTGNIATSPQVGAFVRWHAGPASAQVRFLQSAHAGYGNQVTFGVGYTMLAMPRDRVTVSADTVWANGAAEQTAFGIDGEQAANSSAHLSVYSPSAGFSRVDLKVTVEHSFNAHWSARAALGVDTLVGDAANSPVVERRASVFGSLGAAYRF